MSVILSEGTPPNRTAPQNPQQVSNLNHIIVERTETNSLFTANKSDIKDYAKKSNFLVRYSAVDKHKGNYTEIIAPI